MDFIDSHGAFCWLLALGAIAGAAIVEWATRAWHKTVQDCSEVPSGCGLNGQAVAEQLLAAAGLQHVPIVPTDSKDRYDPRSRQIHLRQQTLEGTSVVSVAVAAHEVGHAQQFAEGYWACTLRRVFWPACFGLMILALVAVPLSVGIFASPLGGPGLAGLCVVALLLQLPIVLPLEYDASRRARALVRQLGLLGPRDEAAFDRVLTAAARTYVAVEARRWILLLVLVLATVWITPHFSADLAIMPDAISQAPVDHFEPAPVIDPDTDVLLMLLPALAELLVPVLCLVLLAWFLRPSRPRERTLRGRAVERNNAGMSLYQRGAVEAAIDKLTEAILLDPTMPAAHYNRGTCYLQLGRHAEAARDFEEALLLAPHFAEALTARGQIALERGEHDLAVADFNEALRLAPRSSVAYACRGNVWLARRDFDRALEDFEAALAISAQEPLAYYGRGRVWLARENLDRALTDFSQALAYGGDNANIYAARGLLWLDKRDYDRAIADLNKAVERNPKSAAALRDRGLAWHLKGNAERALADLDASIHLDASDAVTFNNRGAARFRAGDFSGALADLQEAIRLDPKLANPYKHLAWLEATCPQPEFRNGANAVTNASRALELCPAPPVDWLGVAAAAHAEAGNFGQAVAWQSRCVEQSPPDAKAEAQRRLSLFQANQPLRGPCDGLPNPPTAVRI